jgi:hypothetical protein
MVGFEDETWLNLQPYITNTYMMGGEQQRIFYKGSNTKINAFIITLIHPSSNKIKFKLSKSRTSDDFIDHLRLFHRSSNNKEQNKTVHPCNR